MSEMKLMRGAAAYNYLTAGNTHKVASINDKKDFKDVCEVCSHLKWTMLSMDLAMVRSITTNNVMQLTTF